MGGGGNVVKSHTPNDPHSSGPLALIHVTFSRVSCLVPTSQTLRHNIRGLQGPTGGLAAITVWTLM